MLQTLQIHSVINLCCDLWLNFTCYHPQNTACHSWKHTQMNKTICCWILKKREGETRTESARWRSTSLSLGECMRQPSVSKLQWGTLLQGWTPAVSPDRECKRGLTGRGQHGEQAGTRKEGKYIPHLDASQELVCCNNQTLGKKGYKPLHHSIQCLEEHLNLQ